MANVIHKTSLQYLESVNTPEFPIDDWIINPDLSGLEGIAKRYWKVVGDNVVEMDQSEKDVVDFSTNKTAKLQAIEYWWNSKEVGRILTSSGITLGIKETDVALLVGALNLAEKSIVLGAKTEEDLFPIVDASGNAIAMVYNDLLMLLLEYGQLRSELSYTYVTLKTAALNATSQTDLDNIVIPE
jgi:hypothetical protein